jgi:Outer membrane protein beta-barrel domain
MKKLFIVAVTLIAFTKITTAQKFALVAKGGVNLGKINGVDFNDAYNASLHAGGSVEININKTFGLQPEVLFNQTKTTTVNAGGSLGVLANQNVQLDYLSIPLLLRINVAKFLTLNIGPEYSILMNKSNTVLANGGNAFKDGNFSMIGGAQVNIKNLRVYGRYNIGLSNIQDLTTKDNWKNETIQLGIGFKLF